MSSKLILGIAKIGDLLLKNRITTIDDGSSIENIYYVVLTNILNI